MKIGWILLGNESVASSRVEGVGIHNWMVEQGIDSHMLYKPEGYNLPIPEVPEIEQALESGFTHFVFQKTCFGRAEYYMREAQRRDITVVYVLDDLYPDALPLLPYADIVLAGSSFLQDWIFKKTRIKAKVVNDYYESPFEVYKQEYSLATPPVAMSFSGPGHVRKAIELRSILEDLGYKYEIFSKHPDATIQWQDNYWEVLMKADLIVIPHLWELDDWEKAKGCNRPVTAAVLGLPVVASPYPSYTSVIKQGKTGFICYSNDEIEWTETLAYMKDPFVRENMGKAARESSLKFEYHIHTIGKWWEGILCRE